MVGLHKSRRSVSADVRAGRQQREIVAPFLAALHRWHLEGARLRGLLAHTRRTGCPHPELQDEALRLQAAVQARRREFAEATCDHHSRGRIADLEAAFEALSRDLERTAAECRDLHGGSH